MCMSPSPSHQLQQRLRNSDRDKGAVRIGVYRWWWRCLLGLLLLGRHGRTLSASTPAVACCGKARSKSERVPLCLEPRALSNVGVGAGLLQHTSSKSGHTNQLASASHHEMLRMDFTWYTSPRHFPIYVRPGKATFRKPLSCLQCRFSTSAVAPMITGETHMCYDTGHSAIGARCHGLISLTDLEGAAQYRTLQPRLM